jgi:hypothetical protein
MTAAAPGRGAAARLLPRALPGAARTGRHEPGEAARTSRPPPRRALFHAAPR